MDSKAQASSVFQLLISAIVALAVLMILLQVLGIINLGFNNQNPADAAADLVKTAWNHTATIETTQSNVTFSPSQSNLFSTALAETSKVGISSSAICLSKGDFTASDTDNKIFELNDKKTSLTYKGSGNKVARISVYCYTGSELESTLQEISGAGIDSTWAADCDCVASQSQETCCLVALRFEKR